MIIFLNNTEAQPHQSTTDKSPWRKSSLNVPNSPEEADPRYSRRLRSRLANDNLCGASTLQAIREEERKKNKSTDVAMSDTQDELTIYLCNPTITSQTSGVRKLSKTSKKSNDDDKVSDKIEIDSDNIETPPVTRRVFSPPREVKPIEKEPCKRERCSSSIQAREVKVGVTKPITDLGLGNFDRYSAARKTRRYKKNQDNPLDKDKQEGTPENIEEKPARPKTLSLEDNDQDADSMLRVWQDKLKRRHAANDMDTALEEIAKSGEEIHRLTRPRSSRLPITQPAPVIAVTNTVLSPVMQESRPRETTPVWPERAVSCRERHRSMIDPSQVREALRLTSNPPSQVNHASSALIISPSGDCEPLPILRVTSPEPQHDQVDRVGDVKRLNSLQSNRVDPPMDISDDKNPPKHPMFKSKFIPDINITSNSPLVKGKDQELNDEGFEETQSLVSETLSQETSSGNYETDTHDSPRCSPAEMRYDNKNHTETIKRVGKDEIARLKAFGTRPGSMRISGEKTSFLPKKTESLKREAPRKSESSPKRIVPLLMGNSTRNDVERSGSRSSLRSSRSSLNSATSVNTVRKLAPSHSHLRNYTSTLCAMTNDLRKGNSQHPTSMKDIDKRQLATRNSVTRIPASRSSSSGSSVGPVARNIRKLQAVSDILLIIELYCENFYSLHKWFFY